MPRSPWTLGPHRTGKSRTGALWFAALLLLVQALLPTLALAASESRYPNKVLLCTPDGVQWATYDRDGELTVVNDAPVGMDHGDDCGVCIHGCQTKVLSSFGAGLQSATADGAELFRRPVKLQAALSQGDDRIRAPPV